MIAVFPPCRFGPSLFSQLTHVRANPAEVPSRMGPRTDCCDAFARRADPSFGTSPRGKSTRSERAKSSAREPSGEDGLRN